MGIYSPFESKWKIGVFLIILGASQQLLFVFADCTLSFWHSLLPCAVRKISGCSLSSVPDGLPCMLWLLPVPLRDLLPFWLCFLRFALHCVLLESLLSPQQLFYTLSASLVISRKTSRGIVTSHFSRFLRCATIGSASLQSDSACLIAA